MGGSTGRQIGKIVLVAVVVEAVVVLGTVVINYLAKSAPAAWQVVLVPAAGVLIAGLKAGVDAIASGRDRQSTVPAPTSQYSGYGGGVYGPRRSPPVAKRPGSVIAVLAVLLLVCGGGGLAVTAGIHFGYGWATGNEDGPVVYQGNASGRAGAVTMTATRAMITRHFTRVDVTVRNAGRQTVTLPLFENCQLVDAGGRALKADPSRSQWSNNVAPGGTQSGIINLGGEPQAGRATLSFGTVFGFGGGGALVVRGIPIGEA